MEAGKKFTCISLDLHICQLLLYSLMMGWGEGLGVFQVSNLTFLILITNENFDI